MNSILVFEKVKFHNLVEGIKYYIVFNDLMKMNYIGVFRNFSGIKVINAKFTNVSILYPGYLLENKKETIFFGQIIQIGTIINLFYEKILFKQEWKKEH